MAPLQRIGEGYRSTVLTHGHDQLVVVAHQIELVALCEGHPDDEHDIITLILDAERSTL